MDRSAVFEMWRESLTDAEETDDFVLEEGDASSSTSPISESDSEIATFDPSFLSRPFVYRPRSRKRKTTKPESKASSSSCASPISSSCFSEESDPEIEKDCSMYPPMRSGDMSTFYSSLAPSLMEWSMKDDCGPLVDIDAVPTSAASSITGEVPTKPYREREITMDQADDYRAISLGLNELAELTTEIEIEEARSGVMQKPDVYMDVTKLRPFEIFSEKWIAAILSDAAVESAFVYLQSIACGGIGAVDPDIEPTVHFLEALGMTVTKSSEDANTIVYRAHFSPKSLNSKDEIEKSDAVTASSSTRSGVISRAMYGFHERASGGFSKPTLAEQLQRQVLIEASTDSAFQFKYTRDLALADEQPIDFGFSTDFTPTPEEMLEEKSRSILSATHKMDSGGWSDISDSDDSSDSDPSDDSSSDEEDTRSRYTSSRHAAYSARPSRYVRSTYDVLRKGITGKLMDQVRKRSSEARKRNPDSVARATGELSGWIEDCLCIDIVIFPGMKRETDDKIPRQLVFSFGMCQQNPYSTYELIKGVTKD